MMLLKLMILGKPTSHPKKILSKAETIEQLAAMLVDCSTGDLALKYNLNLKVRENILSAIFMILRHKEFSNYVNNLKDAEYDSSRFFLWKQFREKNKTHSTSVEYFKVKYGDNWQARQQEYRDNRPNIYDIKTWISKGMTPTDAKVKVDRIKYETGLSLKRCIELYGEAGKERHAQIHKFHKNYADFWGNDLDGFDQYKKETNRLTVEFWMKRGYHQDDAIKKISEIQRAHAGVHREYWQSKGLSKIEIDAIMEDIASRKDSSSLKFCIKKYGEDLGKRIFDTRRKLRSSCFREYGKMAEELRIGYDAYCVAVSRYTRLAMKNMPCCPGIRGKKRGMYQVDHKFSRMQGFIDDIPPEIIGAVQNLEWIPVEENCSKRKNCSTTLKHLMKEINEN